MKMLNPTIVFCTLLLASGAYADSVDPLLNPDGYQGRLKLAATLDDPRGYCLDVPGPASNILLHIPAWTHSCHPSAQPDQVYRFNRQGKGKFRFVHESYDLCLTARSAEPQSRFSYEGCRSDAIQGFVATPDGALKLKGTTLCLVAMNMEPGGSQTQAGLGRQVQATHMVRGLTLRQCGAVAPELQRWIAIQE